MNTTTAPALNATAEELAHQLQDARKRELELLADLSDDQLLGPRLRIIEPPIWELGHIGWFQERWILRNLDGAAPLRNDVDLLYDSYNIPNAERWGLTFPTRQETLDYISAVLERCLHRLAVRELTDEELYFFRLALYHEDMHTE
ncbi:MAG: DinB family protein, partial [Anaerolineae bacterium]